MHIPNYGTALIVVGAFFVIAVLCLWIEARTHRHDDQKPDTERDADSSRPPTPGNELEGRPGPIQQS